MSQIFNNVAHNPTVQGFGFPKARDMIPKSFSHFLQPLARRHLERDLAQGHPLALFFLSIENLAAFEKMYGEEMAAYVTHEASTALEEAARSLFTSSTHIFADKLDESGLIVVCDVQDKNLRHIQNQALSLRLCTKTALNRKIVEFTGQGFDLRWGYALVPPIPARSSLVQCLYQALCDAQAVALGILNPEKCEMMEEFRRILSPSGLRMRYQPIIDFSSGKVLGWEALARGPEGSPLESPAYLFDFAEEVGAVFALEAACREQAVRQLGPLRQDEKLFLNIHPRTVVDPNFQSGKTLELLQEYGLTPKDVVFEITERHCVKDFTAFHRTLSHYRQQGYLVAIDDVGTGYSGLRSIAETQPDFIKIDMSLIRGIETNPIKRSLLEALVTFAERIDCEMVAEGIESEREMNCLRSLKVHYGQGFFLARPSCPKPTPQIDITEKLIIRRSGKGMATGQLPIAHLLEAASFVSPAERVERVQTCLKQDTPISCVVVVDDGRPVGLVMSHHLDRRLGTRFGHALYANRAVSQLMDPEPLIVEGHEAVEHVAKAAMRRERYKIYDYIIVTSEGLYLGVVSVQNMLDHLARLQIEMAKGANPLTGLPGNLTIEQEIERRMETGEPFSLIYADLDFFKAYNDVYGFKNGDGVIVLLGRLLRSAIQRYGSPDDFLGHVGGDDFVAVINPQGVSRISQKVVKIFPRLVRGCFSKGDRDRGSFRAHGKTDTYPLTSVSLAVVDCKGACAISELSRRAAEAKKYAKSLPGNVWVRDRRRPLGEPDEDLIGTPVQCQTA